MPIRKKPQPMSADSYVDLTGQYMGSDEHVGSGYTHARLIPTRTAHLPGQLAGTE